MQALIPASLGFGLALACLVLPGSSYAEESFDPASVSAGEATYMDFCSSCHGEALRNTSGGVTFDLRRLGPDEHDRFIRSVTNGKSQMPPWGGVLSPEQMESIWAYVQTNRYK